MNEPKSTNPISGTNPPFLLQQKRAALKRKISNRNSNIKSAEGPSNSLLEHKTAQNNLSVYVNQESKEKVSNNVSAVSRTININSYDIETETKLVSSKQTRYTAFPLSVFGSDTEFDERPLWRPSKKAARAARVDEEPRNENRHNACSLNYLRDAIKWVLGVLYGLLFIPEVDESYAYPIEDYNEQEVNSLYALRTLRENKQTDIELKVRKEWETMGERNSMLGDTTRGPGRAKQISNTQRKYAKATQCFRLVTEVVPLGESLVRFVPPQSSERKFPDCLQGSKLVIDVNVVTVDDHPLCCDEERLHANLSKLFKVYQHDMESDASAYYASKLEYHVNETRKFIDGVDLDACDDFYPLIQDCRKRFEEIIQTGSLLMNTKHKERLTFDEICHAWQKLKVARETQGFSLTQIHVHSSNRQPTTRTDSKEDEKQINYGNNRIALDAERGSSSSENIFRNTGEVAQHLYRLMNELKEELSAQAQQKEHVGINQLQAENDHRRFHQLLTEIGKLESNPKFEDIVLHKVYYRQGDNQLTELPAHELKRQESISSEMYYLQLLIDGQVVGKTKGQHLDWPSLKIEFNERFRCRLHQEPRSICIQLIRPILGGFFGNIVLCSTFVDAPDFRYTPPNQLDSNQTTTDYQFSGNKAADVVRNLKGSIRLRVCWEVGGETVRGQEEKNVDDSPTFSHNLGKQRLPRFNGNIDSRILSLNKNNEVNHDAGSGKSITIGNELQLAFKVPNSNTTYLNYFELLKSKYQKSTRPNDKEDDKELRPADLQPLHDRLNVMKNRRRNFVTEIKAAEQSRQKGRKHSWSTDDVVQEQKFDIFMRPISFVDLFPPRRRNLRQNFSNRPSGAKVPRSCRLLVKVISARNIPRRCDERTSAANLRQEMEAEPNSIFAQVSFQSSTKISRAVSGSAPVWKQALDLPFSTSGSLSPADLRQNLDLVKISIFEENELDVRSSGGYYDDEYTIVSDKRYLGHLLIPFRTIYRNGSTDGSFRLISPDFLLGYEYQIQNKSKDQRPPSSDHPSNNQYSSRKKYKRGGPTVVQLAQESEASIQIKLAATICPLISDPVKTPKPSQSCYCMKGESDALREQSRRWLGQLSKENRSTIMRSFQISAPDVNGNNWFLPRYLKCQNLPPSIDSVQKCAHFVSLIPDFQDRQFFKEATDGWFSNQQILDLQVGGRSEHAVLLANYFLSLSDAFPETCGANIYLVIGEGISEGNAVYVLRRCRQSGDAIIWDAKTGSAYTACDPSCPARNITTLVDCENVYANLLPATSPHLMTFDLSIRKAWKPFYSERFPPPTVPLPSIQEASLSYTEPDHDLAIELQDELQETIRMELRRCRRRPTSFKGDISTRLLSFLEHLEDSRLGIRELTDTDYLNIQSVINRGRKSFGGSFHFSFTDIDGIVAKIKATEIHQTKHPDAEFALVVRVFPYCNNLFSVWVTLFSLFPSLNHF